MAKVSSASVATGATFTQDVNLGATEVLAVIASVGPTSTASGDLTLTVAAYTDADRGSPEALVPLALNAFDSTGATLVSGKTWKQAQYRVSGYRKVQIQVKNNNVGALPVEVTYQLA